MLEIDAEQHFDYESVYFDTPDSASYFLAAHPRRRRFKARTRSYLNSGDCYLEVKTKGSRGTTAKQRLPYSFDERNQLTAAGREYIGELLNDASVAGIDTETMAPVLTTRYTRTTLFLPGSGSRCTIDSGLEWQRNDVGLDSAAELGGAAELRFDDTVIVETKSAGQASEVDRILWRMGHRPDRISKFATGLAALSPELPHNRWSRVLRRHFLRRFWPSQLVRPSPSSSRESNRSSGEGDPSRSCGAGARCHHEGVALPHGHSHSWPHWPLSIRNRSWHMAAGCRLG
ncbi:VTC domain-containing protein [Salinibacterium sp. PAMC 21357]|uniref:VTC domain-containing protein n=1 Tax=Salinibacterium sp. PAMC 21357 TaxID=1112215 RepID=UPI000288CE41